MKKMKKLLLSAVFIAFSFTSFSQVGVGTSTPNASAALDVSSTTKGFLPPRMTKVQLEAIASPIEGLMVYCTDCVPKTLYVFDAFNFVSISNNTPSGLSSTDVYSGATGKTWMDRNLGATQVATSSADAASYGDLYQWGRASDGHESRTSTNTTTQSSTDTPGNDNFVKGSDDWRLTVNDNLWQGVSGTNNPCPSGYRLPTETELNAERLAFATQNAAGAFVSVLKLPAAGYRVYSSGSLFDVSASGVYWTSTVVGDFPSLLFVNSMGSSIENYYKSYGFSVRCIKD